MKSNIKTKYENYQTIENEVIVYKIMRPVVFNCISALKEIVPHSGAE